jgi:hypothetical protein
LLIETGPCVQTHMFDDADLEVLPARVSLVSLGAEHGDAGVHGTQLRLVRRRQLLPPHHLVRCELLQQAPGPARRRAMGLGDCKVLQHDRARALCRHKDMA